jgi:hypothetical protein
VRYFFGYLTICGGFNKVVNKQNVKFEEFEELAVMNPRSTGLLLQGS